MLMDANLILHGEFNGALVDLDASDAVAIAVAVNDDGNTVIDLKKTGNKGLTAVLVFTEAADASAYDNEALILIEASDELDRHWREVARFPLFYAHIAKVYITVTTPFVASDVTKVLSEASSGDTGAILYISDELFTDGGKGYVLVERDVADDTFDEAVDVVLTADSGSGVGTKTKTTELGLNVQMQPGVYTLQFKTNKRYVRFNGETIDGNVGKVWCFLSNHGDMVDSDMS